MIGIFADQDMGDRGIRRQTRLDSFLDEAPDLVKAVFLCREFSVVMDSDRKSEDDKINGTKARVRDEVTKQGGLCWVTGGREIENYIPNVVIGALVDQFNGAKVPTNEFDKVLDPEVVKKNDFARAVAHMETDEWPLDLRERVTELVDAIHAAK